MELFSHHKQRPTGQLKAWSIGYLWRSKMALLASLVIMLVTGNRLLQTNVGNQNQVLVASTMRLIAEDDQAPSAPEAQTDGNLGPVDGDQQVDSSAAPTEEATEEDNPDGESKFAKLWKSFSPIQSSSNTKLPGFEPIFMTKGFDILLDSEARAFQAFIIEQPIDQRIDAIIIPHQEEPQLNDTTWYFVVSHNREGQPVNLITEAGFQNQLIYKSLKRVENRTNKAMKRAGHSTYTTDSWLIPPAWQYASVSSSINQAPILTFALNRHDNNGTKFNELHHVWVRSSGSTRVTGINLIAGYSKIRKPYADLCNRLSLAPDSTIKVDETAGSEGGEWNVEDYVCNEQVALAEEGFDFGSLTLTMFIVALLNFIVMVIIWVTEGASSEAFVPKGATKRRF